MTGCYERAISGDGAATHEVVSALRPRLTRMAAYYARCSGEDQEDLLQEAWLGLLEALPALDVSIGSPDQYLIQRARWRLLDAIKRARVRRCEPLDDGQPDHGAARAIDRTVDAASVSAFTRVLKQNQREVLGHLLAGRTWREAGDALGCTCANVAYHVRQIRRRYEEWADAPVSCP